jgi:peptidylprolyl isomerase
MKFQNLAQVSLAAALAVVLAACGQANTQPLQSQPTAAAEATVAPTTEAPANSTDAPSAPAGIPPIEGTSTVTASGLEYIESQAGDGNKPVTGQIVSVHYTGYLEDGTVFDSSVGRGSPIKFILGRGQVIQGWDEGIALMSKGAKGRLLIPSELGYGEFGAGPIPPNSPLVFDVELIDFEEGPPPPPEAPTEVNEADYTTTESGLKYYDIEEGEGESPAAGTLVQVNYTGWLEDGTMFDSSYIHGQTLSFIVGAGQMIPGFDEGVSTMKPNGKRQLVIPANLAYGETGAGGVIPPNATIIFEVELLP